MRAVIVSWTAGATILALLAIGYIAGRDVLLRLDALEQKVTAATESAQEAAKEAKIAAEKATAASTTALESMNQSRASEDARQSAVAERTQAEQARLKAEAMATDATQQAETARADVAKVRKERQEELDHMQEMLNQIVETRRTSSGMVMNLSDKALHFEFDSASLSHESRELLSRVAGILLASGGFGLSVHGHTDDVGGAAYNQMLSEKRAQSVRQYLAGAGIPSGTISAKGFGKGSPIAQGESEQARAKNRRVEIVLTDTRIRYLGEAR